MYALRSRICRGVLVLGIISSAGFAHAQAVFVLEPVSPASGSISPGQPITIEVFVENVFDPMAPNPDLIQAYQVIIEVIPLAGAIGTLGLDDPPDANIFVDTDRPDWVFSNASGPIGLVNAAQLKLGGIVFFPPFSQITTRRYCGTYVLAASPGALGDFQVRFKPVDPQTPNDLPLQLINQDAVPVPFTVSPPDGLIVSVVNVAPNDACSAAAVLTDGITSFSSENASTDGPSHPGSGCDQGGSTTIENDIWFDYTASCFGVLAVSTCGSANFDTRLAVYNTCTCPVSDANLLVCNDDAVGCGSTSFAVANNVFDGACYKVRVGGSGNVSGIGSLSVTCIGNDSCGDAEPMVVGATVQGSTRGTTVNDSTSPNCGQGVVDSPGVWYSVVGTGDRMRAAIPTATYDTRLTVYEGGCGSLSCVGDANNVGGTQESITWCSALGVVYRILVHGSGGASGTFSFTTINATCNDGNACTNDSCVGGACVNSPNYDSLRFCCNPISGTLAIIDDDNPCTNDVCNENTGNVTHPPVPDGLNVECDDRLACTLDECTSGACTHDDINAIPCQNDTDCPGDAICGDGTGGTQAGVCFCDSGPTLELVPVPGALAVDGCYGVGEFVQVRVEMGVAEDPIVGAQFFLAYDPSTLDFLSIQPGVVADPASPFALEFSETVDEFSGTIDYLVGVTFGAAPTLGPETVAVMVFRALAECGGFVEYRSAGPGGQPNLLTAAGGGVVDPILLDSPPLKFDVAPPSVTGCPVGVIIPSDPGLLTAVVTWTSPIASDSCDVGFIGVSCNPPSGSTFSAGTTTVSCVAVDSCGLTDNSCSFDITVEPASLTVDVQLSAIVDAGPFQRCITIDLWDCDGPPEARHVTVDRNVTFNNGVATSIDVAIPGGAWECVSVRDPLHTLRSTATDLATLDGINYSATFTGSRDLGGHWLIGGNLNDDDFIDILDFGVLFPLHLTLANTGTPCGVPGPDGNINGDNLVDLLDLVIFVGNSLRGSDPECCGSPVTAGASGGPIMSITVEELRDMGLESMIDADVNRDGILDLNDVAALFGGQGIPPDGDGSPRPVTTEKPGRRGGRTR